MAKKPAKKNKVYSLSDGEASGIIIMEASGVAAWIEGAIDNADVGDEFTFDIKAIEMTDKEIKELPEYDG